jgi:hypothetical protein
VKKAIEAELDHAQRSRQEGNEGRARVCARRAAGMAARDFLARRGVHTRTLYEALEALAALPRLAPDLRQAAVHLTTRVTDAFSLPVEADLIAEATKLCEHLPDIE